MEADESDKANMRREIIQYLHMHPNAADSLNGVIDWWLSDRYQAEDVKEVEQVLGQLITDGLVKKIFLVDSTVLYKRNGKWG